MSLLLNRPEIHGQILVSYSEERKREMRESHEKSCIALASLIQGRINELGIKIENMTQASNKEGGCADIVIQFVSSKDDLRRLHEAMKNLDKKEIGVGSIGLFLLRK